VIGQDATKDVGEVWINFVRKLSLGENVSNLRVTWDPVKLVDTILLALADKVEAAFNVARLAGEFAFLDLAIWTVASLSIIAGVVGKC
jgi:hypothetical protein